MTAQTQSEGRPIALGLKENWRQFSLLVLINAFVGGMVGIERTVVPLIGREEFRLASTTLITSFIISFGVVKALANLISGQLADQWGRKRVLVLGWLAGLPVPFLIIAAPDWSWIVAANALVPEGRQIPPRSLVVGTPGRVIREITDAEYERILQTSSDYVRLAAQYLQAERAPR